MSDIPKPGELVVRRIPFEFPDDLNPHWHPHIEWSHMVNGMSLAMPYLEPFLVATMREATALLPPGEVLDEARGFIGQEAQHYTTHRRYNEVLKAGGYAELAEVEAAMQASYDRLRRRSLAYRLAYACGFETMTMGITHWLVRERSVLFGGSDTRIASFILWHFVEEAEHKRVAYDVYQALDGRYWPRFLGVFIGSAHVFYWSRKGAVAMLKKDGRWRDWRSRWRLWRRTAESMWAVLPTVIRSASPWHDPRSDEDPAWVRAWIAGYASAPAGQPPLIDTQHPDVPIPFAQEAAA